MNIIEFAPRLDREKESESLQRKALDEISQKLAVAQKACRAVAELLEVMTELAELVEQLRDHPLPAVAIRVNSASMKVQSKLAALGSLHGQLLPP